MRQVGHLLNL